MPGKLDGKVALVTGASSGIGEATAIALAEAGAKVAVSARRTDRLQKLAEKLGKDKVLPITCDVANKDAAFKSVEETQKHFGRLDILVNNAGIMVLGPFDEMPMDEWEKMVRVNVLGLMYCTHAAIPIMKKQKCGHIVNISSVAGRKTSANGSVYHATKWAVGGFSESIRELLCKENIRVTVIEPGAVLTELTDHIGHDGTKKMIKDWVASMDALKSEDIANTIAYAVSQPGRVNISEVLIRPTAQER